MARTLRRRPLLSRLFTTYLTLVVVVMFTGIAGAVPVSFAEENNPEAIEGMMASAGSEESSGAASPAEAPVESDAAPEEEVEAAAEKEEAAPSEEIKVPEASALMMAPAADEISVSLAAPGTGISTVKNQGYNRWSGWTPGNLGKNYSEGDWVPYRMVLRNTGTDDASPLDLIVGFDHYSSGSVFVDETRMWGYAISDTEPLNSLGDGPPAGFTAIVPTSQDVGAQGSASTIITTIESGSFVIPAGKYATVYFQAHLAMTLEWMPRAGLMGAGGYPGSSGHVYLLHEGKKTIPLPAVELPAGSIKVFKFYDTNQNGQKDANETQMLSGWVMNLKDAQGNQLATQTTNANGEAVFMWLPPGDYKVSETLQPGWDSNTQQPISITIVNVKGGDLKTAYIGNFELMPEIELTKSGTFEDENADGIAQVGETISYTFKVENTGNVMLYDVMVSDPLVTVVGGPLASLAIGAYDDTTFTASYTLTQDDIDAGEVYNLATVDAEDATGTPVSDTDDETVLLGQRAAIELTKSGTWVDTNANGFADVGEPINYTFTVSNTGNVTLYNVTVSDPLLTVSGGPLFSLAVGGTDSTTFTGVYYLTQADIDAGQVYNEATATGYDPDQEPVTDIDDETVHLPQNPELTLLKEASPATYDAVGDEITYTYTLTNSGNVTLSGPFTVDDDKATTSRVGAVPVPDELAPGAHITFTATYTIDQDDLDAGSVKNIAQGFGYFDDEIVESNEDDETVTSVPAPELTLVKLATPVTYDAVGDEITYTYTLTNTGNVTLMGPFSVDDDKATVTPVGMLPMVLAPDAFIDFEATYTITQADLDAGSVTNIARGHGYYNQEPVHSNYDDETVTAVQNPELTLLKEASPATYDAVGDEITYTYTLTNSGNVTLSGPFTVDDDKATTSRVGAVPDPDVLAPGDHITFTATYTITQADLDAGSVTNIAIGHGYFGEDEVIVDSNEDDETVAAEQAAALMLVKTAAPAFYEAVGDVITYTYTLTNSGNVTLSGPFTVDDDKATTSRVGAVPVPDELASGDTITFTAIYVITQADLDNGSVTNIAQGHGFFGETPVDSNYDDETVIADEFLGFPDLGVKKSADRTTADPGDTITYTIVVTNFGSASVSGYTLVDTFDQRYLAVIDAAGGVVSNGKITWTFAEPLAAGASRTITYKMLVSENMPNGTTYLDNVVVVSHPDDENPDNDRSTWRVTVEEEPFLPFTGADLLGLLALAGAAAATGATLRRRSRKDA